jgi:protein-tyrosine-phosphatase
MPKDIFPVQPLRPIGRRTFVLSTMAFSTALAAKTVRRRRVTVLFVCEAGTIKSPMAREIFRAEARKRGIDVYAFSRAIAPEDHLTRELRDRMRSDAIDVKSEPVRKLTASDVKRSDLVVFFNMLPTAVQPKATRDWTDVPSVVNDYDRALAVMREKISGLLDDLQ